MTFRIGLIGGLKIEPRQRAASEKVIQTQSVISWADVDVLVWLEGIGQKDAVKAFAKNSINGETLALLTDADLVAMKIDKLGSRKAILRGVLELNEKKGSTAVAKKEGESEKDSSQSSTSSKSIKGPVITVKVVNGPSGPFELLFAVEGREVRFSKISRKLEAKIGYMPVFSVTLPKEATVTVEDQADWQKIWAKLKEVRSCEVSVRQPGVNDPSKAERSLLDSLVDGAVLATTDMTILFVNTALLRMTGYAANQLLGQNVTKLMQQEVAVQHASYVNNYLRTGTAKVIGKGRHVQVRRTDGSVFQAWLSVTEQKKATGRHTFMATLHEVQIKIRDSALENFSVLDAVQKCVLVADIKGIVRFMNRHAEGLLGWREEALGKNLNTFMPAPYNQQHDSYLANYLRSGKPKIIGRPARLVVAQRKDGSTVPVDISVDEISVNGERFFIGVLRESSKAMEQHTATLLQDTRGVVNSLTVAAIVIDKNGLIQAFNHAAERLFGYGMVDVLGENIKKLMNPDDATKHDGYISNYIKSGVAKVIGKNRTVLIKTIDGTLTPVTLSVSKNVDLDNPENFLFVGMLVPTDLSGGVSYGALERNEKKMSSYGESTITSCSSVRDFGAAEDQNVKHRSTMEDQWVMVDCFNKVDGSAYFALFDGHSGAGAAEASARQLHNFLMSSLRKSPEDTIASHFESAYLNTHESLGSEIGKSGCTAVTCWLAKQGASRTLHVANVGDSRAVLLRGTNALRLTKDHKPDDPEEKQAVIARGGLVMNGRISGILAVSRSLGDYRADKYVSRVPTVSSTPLTSGDSVLLLACDGLFDVCTDQEVMDICAKGRSANVPAQRVAKMLVDTAITKGTTDNVTVMVIYL